DEGDVRRGGAEIDVGRYSRFEAQPEEAEEGDVLCPGPKVDHVRAGGLHRRTEPVAGVAAQGVRSRVDRHTGAFVDTAEELVGVAPVAEVHTRSVRDDIDVVALVEVRRLAGASDEFEANPGRPVRPVDEYTSEAALDDIVDFDAPPPGRHRPAVERQVLGPAP